MNSLIVECLASNSMLNCAIFEQKETALRRVQTNMLPTTVANRFLSNPLTFVFLQNMVPGIPHVL